MTHHYPDDQHRGPNASGPDEPSPAPGHGDAADASLPGPVGEPGGGREASSRRRGGLSPYTGARPYRSGYLGYAYGGGYGGYSGYYQHNEGGGSPYGDQSPTAGGFGSFSVSRLLRRKWLMLAVFVLVSGAAIPWIWVLNHPVYKSSAVIRISPVVSRLVFRTENNGYLPLYQSYLNTQMAIIRSPKILERVLDRVAVRETSWYKEEGRGLFGGKRDRLSRLMDAVSIRHRKNTELIDVTVTAENAHDAKLIADAIVDEHRAFVDETARENEGWLLETLAKERAALQKEIDGLIATRYNLAKRLGSLNSSQVQGQLTGYLNVLDAEYRRLQRTLDITRWEIEKIEAEREAQRLAREEGAATAPAVEAVADKPEDEVDYTQDPVWRQMVDNVDNIDNQIEITLLDYGPEHPRVKRLRATRQIAERLLAERREELDHQWQEQGIAPGGESQAAAGMPVGDRLEQLKDLALRTEQEIQLLREEMDRQRAYLSDITDISLELDRYEDDIENKKHLAEAVRKRLEALEFEGKASPARVKVTSYAVKPSKPDSDRRPQMTVMTLAAALMVALAAGYLRSTVDKRIYDVGEVQQVYRAPFLGLLPSLPSSKIPRELGGTRSLGQDDSSYYGYGAGETCQSLMESVRMVRTALLERVNEEDQRAVLVTSAVPRTGKTSVTLLLARSLAMLNKRVLLVEGDLRHPTLAGRLNIESQAGLAAVLAGTVTDEQAIVNTEIPNLDILAAGDIPDDFTTEMLANGVFVSCMERWKQAYDFTLLDSPPILPVADARILSGYVDGTLMVLRASHDLRNEAMEAYAQLSAAGGKLVGTVFIGGEGNGKSRPYGYSYLQSPATWRWRQRYTYQGGTPGDDQMAYLGGDGAGQAGRSQDAEPRDSSGGQAGSDESGPAGRV